MLNILYPEIQPYNSFYIKVSNLHTVYVEESGNPSGNPVIFLHGGPGGGIEPIYRQFFNPEKWRIILFDQRGCGKSLPHSEIKENTTWDLVKDIEKIRKYLNIDKWVIFGGSWGSTLALSYSILNPNSCKALILRGIFLLRKLEIDWFYQEGCSYIFPDEWENYIQNIPNDERNNFVKAYYKRLTSSNIGVRQKAALAWSKWESSTSYLIPKKQSLHNFNEVKNADAFARIECHYFYNGGFFESKNWILENANKLKGIPGVIVQGRYDVVCPIKSAWELHKRLPHFDFHIIKDSGHSMLERGIQKKLVEYTDKYINY